MKIAVKSGDKFTGYSGRFSGNKFIVQSKDGRVQRGSLVALPYSEFAVKKFSLPKLTSRELAKTVGLQLSYNFPEQEFRFTHKIVSGGKNSMLFMTGSSTAPEGSYRAVLPDLTGLYCITARFGLLTDNCVIVYKDSESACCMTVYGGSPAFMRNIASDDLVREIRLSAQDQYNAMEARLADPQKIIFISDDNDAYMTLKETFTCSCFRIALNDVVEVPKGRPSRDDVIAAGIASYPKFAKNLKGWNLTEGAYDPRKAVSRGLMYSVPVWIAFLYLMMAGDNRDLRKQIDGAEGRLRALAPKYRQVADLQYQVTNIQQFMDESGSALERNRQFIELSEFLINSKPAELNLHSISGRFSGTVVITGIGKSFDQVTDFVKKIKKYESLTDVQLIYSEHAEEHGVDFQVSMKLGQNEESK